MFVLIEESGHKPRTACHPDTEEKLKHLGWQLDDDTYRVGIVVHGYPQPPPNHLIELIGSNTEDLISRTFKRTLAILAPGKKKLLAGFKVWATPGLEGFPDVFHVEGRFFSGGD